MYARDISMQKMYNKHGVIEMELRSLYYFLVVSREENITHAADYLHLTQPTLSRILMQLEEDVGTQLMIRGKRKIQLTEAGLILRRRAEEILDLVEKTEQEIGSDDKCLEGKISIGAAECLAAHIFLPEVIESFARLHPRVTYDLYTGNADLIKEQLDRGIMDIGILLEPVDMVKYDFIRLPQKEKWGILVKRDHPLAEKKQVTPADLCGIPLINPKRSVVQNEIASWSKEYYGQFHFIATYNLISNAMALAERGLGTVITAKGALYHHSSKKVKFIPFQPSLTTGTVLAWKKNQTLPQIILRFVEHIYQILESETDTEKEMHFHKDGGDSIK